MEHLVSHDNNDYNLSYDELVVANIDHSVKESDVKTMVANINSFLRTVDENHTVVVPNDLDDLGIIVDVYTADAEDHLDSYTIWFDDYMHN